MFRSALLTASLLCLTLTGQADRASVRPEDYLPPRPQLSEYQDENAFVADMLAWQRARAGVIERIERGELPPPAPSHRQDNDWHHVTGPEDIDQAVNNARGYQQPRYREKRRFNRTTHLSFPLPPLPVEQMADEGVDLTPEGTPDQSR